VFVCIVRFLDLLSSVAPQQYLIFTGFGFQCFAIGVLFLIILCIFISIRWLQGFLLVPTLFSGGPPIPKSVLSLVEAPIGSTSSFVPPILRFWSGEVPKFARPLAASCLLSAPLVTFQTLLCGVSL